MPQLSSVDFESEIAQAIEFIPFLAGPFLEYAVTPIGSDHRHPTTVENLELIRLIVSCTAKTKQLYLSTNTALESSRSSRKARDQEHDALSRAIEKGFQFESPSLGSK